jgi:hypothetical protein
VDDAIDDAIAVMEDFIVANSRRFHSTRPMLEDLKRRTVQQFRDGLTRQQYCEGREAEFFGSMRSTNPASPDRVREWVKELLSTPPELFTGACL